MTMIETETAPADVVMGWSGVLLPLGVFAGDLDRRMFRNPSWPPLPLTLADNHWGTEMLGPIDVLEVISRDEAVVRLGLTPEEAALLGEENLWGQGRFGPGEEAVEVAAQLAFWGRLPVSVEVRDGTVVETVTEDPDVVVDPAIDEEVPPMLQVESVWDPCVIGAVAIERLPAFAGAFIRPDPAAAAAEPVVEAPADGEDLAAVVETLRSVAAPEVVRAAGAGPVRYPADFFTEVDLGGPTRLTISPEGEVLGHVAVWGETHRADGSWAATPCGDLTDFLVGTAALDDGSFVRAGVIVSDGLHAPAHAPGSDGDTVRRLIESTAQQVATVHAWEDEWGMAVHGSTLPGVDAAAASRALAGCPSVDQRDFGDGRGFVTCGVLVVNTCGFRPGSAVVSMEDGAPVRRLVASAVPARAASCGCGSRTAAVEEAPAPAPQPSDGADVGRLARLDAEWERARLKAATAPKP